MGVSGSSLWHWVGTGASLRGRQGDNASGFVHIKLRRRSDYKETPPGEAGHVAQVLTCKESHRESAKWGQGGTRDRGLETGTPDGGVGGGSVSGAWVRGWRWGR